MGEECEKTNYLLKKSEIDLNEKDDLLLSNRTIADNTIEIDKLNKNILISTEQINSLRQQLDEQTSFTSKLALEKENEITELNKFINDSVQANNNKMLQREQEHMERINEYELNKANLINSHNVIKTEL